MEPLRVKMSDTADGVVASGLPSQAQGFDNGPVALNILVFDIIQESAAPADQHQQPSSGMVIFGVNLEVFRQIGNTVSNEADLHFRGAGVAFMKFILVDELFLVFGFKNHFLYASCCSIVKWVNSASPLRAFISTFRELLATARHTTV
jgi:hypothetical protein